MTKTTIQTIKVRGPFKQVHEFYDLFEGVSKPAFVTRYVSDKIELREETYIQLNELKNNGEILDFSPVEEVIVRNGYFSFLIIEENKVAELKISLRNLIPIPEEIKNDKTKLAENYQDWFLEEFGVSNDVLASETADTNVFKNENNENIMEILIILETGFGNLDIFLEKMIARFPDFEFYSTYQSVEEEYAGVIYWSKNKHTHTYYDPGVRNIYGSYRHYILENTELPVKSCSNCNADLIPAFDNNICPNCGTFSFK